MAALMVSGILYTPIGDPKIHSTYTHHKNQLEKFPHKFPLPVLGQDEGMEISNPGRITRIKQLWFKTLDGKEVPVYYVLGFIENKIIISEILESALSNNNNKDYYHSWCAWLNNMEYSELVPSVYTGKPEWTVTGGRFDRFLGAYVCCTPCVHYAHLFLPYMGDKANSILERKHFRSHYYHRKADIPGHMNKTFNKIRMDQDRFDDLFGMYKFKKDKLINYKNPKKFI